MAVPRVALDLDDLNIGISPTRPSGVSGGLGSPGSRSLAAESVREGIEDEKCVVAQYRTNFQQRQLMSRLLDNSSLTSIPIEWVIDIADESNGWFYGTAYHYNDATQMLHVMVPDKQSPTFEGHVQLDHRTVHLIECVDGQSMALFNKIVRDSIIKIKWALEWYEEPDGDNNGNSGWISSFARYYIRMANQLLVEDKDLGSESRGFVIITADVSVRLLECLKGKGEEDFSRLISEGVVSASDDAAQYAQAVLAAKRSPLPAEASRAAAATTTTVVGSAENATAGKGDDDALVKKLVDMSKGLRDCVDDLLDERTKRKDESSTLTALFRDFALGGDLDCGLRLLEQTSSAAGAGSSEEEERMEAIVEDAKYLSHKLERTLHKAAAAGQTLGSGEDEDLRKAVKKLKKEIEERDRELRVLRGR